MPILKVIIFLIVRLNFNSPNDLIRWIRTTRSGEDSCSGENPRKDFNYYFIFYFLYF